MSVELTDQICFYQVVSHPVSSGSNHVYSYTTYRTDFDSLLWLTFVCSVSVQLGKESDLPSVYLIHEPTLLIVMVVHCMLFICFTSWARSRRCWCWLICRDTAMQVWSHTLTPTHTRSSTLTHLVLPSSSIHHDIITSTTPSDLIIIHPPLLIYRDMRWHDLT